MHRICVMSDAPCISQTTMSTARVSSASALVNGIKDSKPTLTKRRCRKDRIEVKKDMDRGSGRLGFMGLYVVR